MKERRDDTTKTGDESRPLTREPGAYYYDDATGYEPYAPGEDEEQTDEDVPEGEERADEED